MRGPEGNKRERREHLEGGRYVTEERQNGQEETGCRVLPTDTTKKTGKRSEWKEGKVDDILR